jgi:Cu+-exporting ATPase
VKEVKDMATDLVCGMIVNPASAPARMIFAGNEYSFCTTHCKKVFEKDPQKFIWDSKQWSKAIDPVCGMRVPIPLAGAMSVHKGQFIYFCNKACKEIFDESPETYLEVT